MSVTIVAGRFNRRVPLGTVDRRSGRGVGLHFAAANAYLTSMTKLLEKALEAVRRLPPDSQDEIALAMLTLSGNDGEPEDIAAAHSPAVLEGLAQAKRREFAADAEIEAAFRRFER
jgi:hypothetical protein